MSKKILVANLKMRMNLSDTINYLKVINDKIVDKNVVICPTSLYIPYFLKHNYQVGIQNIYYENNGAYTGEISARQASDIGVKYVILGHSERRSNFMEDNELINKKVISALKNKMKVFLCIGESDEDRLLLKTDKVLRSQLLYALKNIKSEDLKNIFIVYEPTWAISSNGNKRLPASKDIIVTINYIKKLVSKRLQYDNIKVLYGGNVNDKNISQLNSLDELDGFLIGEASCDVNKFLNIIEVVNG